MHSNRLIFLLQGVNLKQQKVAPPAEKSGNESPIISFILLERYNAISLVQTIHQSLAALSKVIRGTQLLSKDVQNLAAALLNQEVSLFLAPSAVGQRAYVMAHCPSCVCPSVCV